MAKNGVYPQNSFSAIGVTLTPMAGNGVCPQNSFSAIGVTLTPMAGNGVCLRKWFSAIGVSATPMEGKEKGLGSGFLRWREAGDTAEKDRLDPGIYA
jgi:hypothetical protein